MLPKPRLHSSGQASTTPRSGWVNNGGLMTSEGFWVGDKRLITLLGMFWTGRRGQCYEVTPAVTGQ